MHKVTITLDGVATDSASVELADAEAFLLFVALKTALVQGGAAKRKARRGAAASDETADGNTANDSEQDSK